MSAQGQIAKRLYLDEGLDLRTIGRKIGRSHEGVRQLLLAEGVTLRTRASGPAAARAEPALAKAPPAAAAAPRDFKAPAARAKTNRSAVRRFSSPPIEPEKVIDLRADHPAVVEGRALFPSQVVSARHSPRLLVSGHNNSKLGKEVLKGPRAGWPIFQLTLEERATCPRSCPVWAGCYGNSSPFSRRHRADDELLKVLRLEVAAVAREYPAGFLVRLHTLGDFFSVEYVLLWAELLAAHPALHVFGYTARRLDAPDLLSRKIAQAIAVLTDHRWDRFSIRTSHAEFGPQRSVVVGAVPTDPDVLACPAQTGATEACATCGLCWAEAARDKTIAFLRHGMKRPGGRRLKVVEQEPAPAAAEALDEPSPMAAPPPAEPGDPARLAPTLVRPPPADRPSEPRRRPPSRAIPRGATFEARGEGVSVIRMKSVSANMVRWSRAYLARGGISVEDLADLFEVPPDALARALRPEAQAA